MGSLQVFDFGDDIVRTSYTDEGEPVVCGADLVRALGLGRPGDEYRRIKDKYRVTLNVRDTAGRVQEMVYFTEPGVYQFLFTARSRDDEEVNERLDMFREWVFEEVLPSIRKTGKFEVPALDTGTLAKDIENFTKIAEFAGLEGNQAKLKAFQAVKNRTGFDIEKELQLALPSPSNEALLTPTELGKRLGIKARDVNLRLADRGLHEKEGKSWRLTEEGKAFGVYLDVNKQYWSGAPIQQIKWRESVIPEIQ